MSKQLEDRFFNYAVAVRDFCTTLKHSIINAEYIKQLVRSSASVGANYIEASDDLGKADERMKIKISRREAKEWLYWVKLVLADGDENLEAKRSLLINEDEQIVRILSAIIMKLSS